MGVTVCKSFGFVSIYLWLRGSIIFQFSNLFFFGVKTSTWAVKCVRIRSGNIPTQAFQLVVVLLYPCEFLFFFFARKFRVRIFSFE